MGGDIVSSLTELKRQDFVHGSRAELLQLRQDRNVDNCRFDNAELEAGECDYVSSPRSFSLR